MAKSIRVETSGGLGNQLFAYFFSLQLSTTVNMSVVMDLLHADRSLHHESVSLLDFDLSNKIQVANTKSRSSIYKKSRTKLLSSRALLLTGESDRLDITDLINEKKVKLIEGDFGSFLYFDNLSGSEKKVALRRKSDALVRFLDENRDTHTQSIHHRLGDFVGLHDSLGLLGQDYYIRAIQNSGEYERCFVFSNDPAYSEYLFRLWGIHRGNMVWIHINQFSNPAENLIAMSSANSIICANSTFSFWGAKISGSSNVFYPEPYRRDSLGSVRDLPSDWIPIGSSWTSLENLI